MVGLGAKNGAKMQKKKLQTHTIEKFGEEEQSKTTKSHLYQDERWPSGMTIVYILKQVHLG